MSHDGWDDDDDGDDEDDEDDTMIPAFTMCSIDGVGDDDIEYEEDDDALLLFCPGHMIMFF